MTTIKDNLDGTLTVTLGRAVLTKDALFWSAEDAEDMAEGMGISMADAEIIAAWAEEAIKPVVAAEKAECQAYQTAAILKGVEDGNEYAIKIAKEKGLVD